jgi:hypothetical protein
VINKLYGTLAPGAEADEFYYRRSTQDEVFYPERDILIPHTTEKAYIQFCADQLCQLCEGSKLSELLLELDPNNTYGRPTDIVTEESTLESGIPPGVILNVLEPNRWLPWIRHDVLMVFDGVTTVTYDDTKTVEWGATETEIMYSNGLQLTLNGTNPGISFQSTVAFTRRPARNLKNLLDELDKIQALKWDERLEPYKDSTAPATRLVAYVLNALTKI